MKRDGYRWTQSFSLGDARRSAGAARGDHRNRYHGHLLREPGHLRDHPVLVREAGHPLPGVRVPQQGPDADRGRRASRPQGRRRERLHRHVPLRRRVDRLRHLPDRHQGNGAPVGDRGRSRARGVGDQPRGGDAVEHLLPGVGAHLRQHDQHPRGRHPRRGVPGRADQHRQQVGRELGLDQEVRGPALRRRHPRGPDRDHLGQAGQPPVRGSDQDQARQHRDPVVRAAGGQRQAGGLVRAEPGRGEVDHPQGAGGRPGPDRGPQGARRRPGSQGTARAERSARQAVGLPVDQPGGVRGLHRRG